MKEYCSQLGIGDVLYSINKKDLKIQKFFIREVIFSDIYPTSYNNFDGEEVIKYVKIREGEPLNVSYAVCHEDDKNTALRKEYLITVDRLKLGTEFFTSEEELINYIKQ